MPAPGMWGQAMAPLELGFAWENPLDAALTLWGAAQHPLSQCLMPSSGGLCLQPPSLGQLKPSLPVGTLCRHREGPPPAAALPLQPGHAGQNHPGSLHIPSGRAPRGRGGRSQGKGSLSQLSPAPQPCPAHPPAHPPLPAADNAARRARTRGRKRAFSFGSCRRGVFPSSSLHSTDQLCSFSPSFHPSPPPRALPGPHGHRRWVTASPARCHPRRAPSHRSPAARWRWQRR